MFAIIETGGKQYRVEKDGVIAVEKLPGAVGAAVRLDQVLLIGGGERVRIGTPFVAQAYVEAEIIGQRRGRKIEVFKKKRRTHYRRRQGHRQAHSLLRITGLRGGGEA